ncbi:MAG: helix-turn-helix domain-containing protein [Actinomycetota bacterium]|nr:helix-turn-helix domain-containing protein [Actinomycetota bacterium]
MKTTTLTKGTPDELLTTDELAALLKVSKDTVHQWRRRAVGPPGITVGRYVRYRRTAVDRWLDERTSVGPRRDG